ncbi:Beta-N-acetylhexosaminidase [Hexamita inflata]|uniref:Beta-hexosaminidase n=1 Tax=Hexamita inflata TaxID=28002 RepID=A0AA86PB30_9EUKA|nr:Beta-N-acetylhexosaminidase [Hexamita inflata]
MIMNIMLTMQVTISPIPADYSIKTEYSPLSELTLNCKYKDTNAQCNQHIFENFKFFAKTLYPREQPYTPTQYNGKGYMNAISQVTVIVTTSSESYDITKMDESYTLDIISNEIKITAANHFALSRAFATLVQLMDVHPELKEDQKAYAIYQAHVSDKAAFPWRELLLDAARHYISLDTLKHQVDALAIAKFNVLHLHVSDAESVPLQFKNAPQNKLKAAQWSPYHYYTIEDMVELQTYANQRGVILYLEIDVPGHVYSWGKADQDIVAHCPSKSSNINNVPINPANEKSYEYLKGILSEIFNSALFTNGNMKISPMIHLGGDEMIASCWREDTTIASYMAQRGMSTDDLWREFHGRVNGIISEITNGNFPYQVYWDDSLQNGNPMTEKSVAHFWTSTDKSAALNQNMYAIQSTNWYLDQMTPTNYSRYRFEDTWMDFYQIDILAGVSPTQKKYVLGGGPCQWGETVTERSIEQHMYPRALAISEVLWSNPSSRAITQTVIDRLGNLNCKLFHAGIKTGTMNPGVPCLGYPEK